ncbi:MAG: precorrin-2 C(20)-methyltransferase [Clostridia bacterium]|jgi:precorrin-2/cobalt-factor-2 C20-methyltransferase|nr:precorrin-2 C(20)-methyltransferase [Clostridia bacterium]
MAGKLWGIGVGPGDPDLITMKAVKVLAQVSVVCVPRARAGQPSLALSIAREYLSPEAKVVELTMPMTEVREKLESAWREAAKTILGYLQAGEQVAFLTIGDPSLYSTFSYVNNVLQQEEAWLDTEVIPGISSFSAAAARLGRPLAEGDEPLVVMPTPQGLDLSNELIDQSNLVLMKVSRDFDKLVHELSQNHRLSEAALVSRVGQSQEFITGDLEALQGQKIDYLSLIISRKP